MAEAKRFWTSLGPIGWIVAAGIWCVATVWLGLVGISRAARFIGRARRSLATTMRCPRGHRVEVYGTFRCPRCKAVREGRAFDPCGICGSRSTHLDCVRCGLAVRDPLL
jgi:hypothetical protein